METATCKNAFIEAMDTFNDAVLISKIDYDNNELDINSENNIPSMQYGENNHMEYSWATSDLFNIEHKLLQEQIIQLSFQLVRCDDNTRKELRAKFSEILSLIYKKLNGNIFDKNDVYYATILYKMVAQTRDIISGKGEYALFYMMIAEIGLYNICHAKFMINALVHDDITYDTLYAHKPCKIHPLGSWKDMKYMASYFQSLYSEDYEKYGTTCSKLITYIIELTCTQLKVDENESGKTIDRHLSLAAKWIPREKSKKHGWLFKELALNYYSIILPYRLHSSYDKAAIKCCMLFRRLLTKLNIILDTTQIKQCNDRWSDINFNNVTSITIQRQKNAFLNLKKDGSSERYPENFDRIECKEHYQEFLSNVSSGNATMKGKRVSIVDMVKDAIYTNIETTSQDIIDTLNYQWENNAYQTSTLKNFIAMVDTSSSMNCDKGNPLYSAIGLGIRVAEKSTFGNRVMTFSATPSWINLDTMITQTFVQKVKRILNSEWGANTNFYAAMKMILDVIMENKVPACDVENMVLVVFSDMQFDQADKTFTMAYSDNINNRNNTNKKLSANDEIIRMYHDAGIKTVGEPYNPPHILFWNLRSTTGFPCVSNVNNVTMFSGYSPSLLNVFCEKGLDALKKYTPWLGLVESLSNPRYKKFSDYIAFYYNIEF